MRDAGVAASEPIILDETPRVKPRIELARDLAARFAGADALPIAVGAGVINDVTKCALRPVSAADYSVSLTDAQLAELREVFPNGVCDFSQPSIGSVPHAGPWLIFKGDAEFEAAALQ